MVVAVLLPEELHGAVMRHGFGGRLRLGGAEREDGGGEDGAEEDGDNAPRPVRPALAFEGAGVEVYEGAGVAVEVDAAAASAQRDSGCHKSRIDLSRAHFCSKPGMVLYFSASAKVAQ